MKRGFSAVVCLAFLALAGQATWPTTGVGDVAHADSGPSNELTNSQRNLLAKAEALAESNSSALSAPWIAVQDGSLVLTYADADGVAIISKFMATNCLSGTPCKPLAVSRSLAELNRIKDDVIGLSDSVVPGASAIFASWNDAPNNRVMVEVGTLDPSLQSGLSARYGDAAVGIQVTPGADGGQLMSRQDDTSPFYGGAAIINSATVPCTDGFAWRISSTVYGMVTAGHCSPDGGWMATRASPSVSRIGTVTSGSRENFQPGVGTVLFPGQTTYRGDLALIQVDSGKSSFPRIYVGNATSSLTRNVQDMPTGRTPSGSKENSGGAVAGEILSWTVDWNAGNWKYTDGTVVRNVSASSKYGWCIRGGDSGGPVYSTGTGSTIAYGIISGGSGGGGDFYAQEPYESRCRLVYTDIYDAYAGLPGTIYRY